jgi:hypothetical protein
MFLGLVRDEQKRCHAISAFGQQLPVMQQHAELACTANGRSRSPILLYV